MGAQGKSNNACGCYEILLATQSNCHLIGEKSMLTNIRKSDNIISVTGVTGTLTTSMVGDMPIFGEVHYAEWCPANVLSWNIVSKKFRIVWDQVKQECRVILPNNDNIIFKERNGLYVGNFKNYLNQAFITTVTDNETVFSKREVEDAKIARDLSAKLGFPSSGILAKFLNRGGIINCPITSTDVRRAEHIYGKDIGAIKGKTTKRTPVDSKHETSEIKVRVNQEIHVDIMFVEGLSFLVSVATPLTYAQITDLKGRRHTSIIYSALEEHISSLREKGFNITVLHTDGEGAIAALKEDIQRKGILFNPAGPEQHVATVERKIRHIKEIARGYICTLPYKLPLSLLPWLIKYSTYCTNIIPSSTNEEFVSPREMFTGRKLDYKKDLRLKFGEYIQATSPNIISNSIASRTVVCIALLPVGNYQGSFKVLQLANMRIVTRDHWVKLPITTEVIQFLNSIALKQKNLIANDLKFKRGNNELQLEEDLPIVEDQHAIYAEETMNPGGIQVAKEDNIIEINKENVTQEDDRIENQYYRGANYDDVDMELEDEEFYYNYREGEVEEHKENDEIDFNTDNIYDDNNNNNSSYDEQQYDLVDEDEISILNDNELNYTEEETHDNELQFTTEDMEIEEKDTNEYLPVRESRGNWRDRYGEEYVTYNITIDSAKEKYGNKIAKQYIHQELQQMLDKKVWRPVSREEIMANKKTIKVISSKMFLKEKLTPEGKFDKLKARLVAGGHQQIRHYMEDVSSPTAAMSSIFMVAALAVKEKRFVTTLDITGAYLNASLNENTKVYMRLDRILSEELIEIDPSYNNYKDENGTIVVRLQKALYGCIESAKLWFRHIEKSLLGLGFIANQVDQCVFNKGIGEQQITVVVYVDDLMITCRNSTIMKQLIEDIKKIYNSITVKEGEVHSYLGMTFNFNNKGEVNITMDKYIDDIINDYSVNGYSATPSTNDLFKLNDSIDLDNEHKLLYHSIVAKLLYLAKRIRPDILTTVSFLSTRVKNPSKEDWKKLYRLLRYIRKTKNLSLKLKIGNVLIIFTYIDAAHGILSNCLSQSGIVIFIGGAIILAKSSKQRINTKSSTESELVALSDGISQVVWTKRFLESQGYEVGPAIIYQDNLSTMKMIRNGKGTGEKTRHIHPRYFFIRNRIECGEIIIRHMPTESMIADLLTKPKQGEDFKNMRKKILGI